VTETAAAPRIAVLLGPQDRLAALEHDVREGLTSTPKRLPPKWHYDEEGSRLFSLITELPEYYLTRCEREILEARAAEIAAASRADTLVELGAGTSQKTRLLLDAMRDVGSLRRIVLLDVDEATLRVIAFLGSSIGNFLPEERAAFLRALRGAMDPGETFLLGADLVKERERLVAAYDDAAGVTARFSLNLLSVLNNELGADFDFACWEHAPRWDRERELMDIRLRSLAEQVVHFPTLDLDVRFAEGEELHTEISAKFRREVLEEELGEAGLEPRAWWTDEAGDFAVSLSLAL
jgi:L-histidine N-alpha-methyltransferase